jgi:hypothetical protein
MEGKKSIGPQGKRADGVSRMAIGGQKARGEDQLPGDGPGTWRFTWCGPRMEPATGIEPATCGLRTEENYLCIRYFAGLGSQMAAADGTLSARSATIRNRGALG